MACGASPPTPTPGRVLRRPGRGLDLGLGGPGALTLDGRYDLGLTDINDVDDVAATEIENRAFSISGGLLFRLPWPAARRTGSGRRLPGRGMTAERERRAGQLDPSSPSHLTGSPTSIAPPRSTWP